MSAIPADRVRTLLEKLRNNIESGGRYPACSTPFIKRRGGEFRLVMQVSNPDGVKIDEHMDWRSFQRAERLVSALA